MNFAYKSPKRSPRTGTPIHKKTHKIRGVTETLAASLFTKPGTVSKTSTRRPRSFPLEDCFVEKSFSSDYFKITLDNKRIIYSGILIKRASPTETDYFLLKPKQSISEEINLKNSYMIDKKGKYKITFIGSSINQLPNSNQLEFIID